METTTTKAKATRLLWQDHHDVRERYHKLADARDPAEKASQAETLFGELEIHAWIEERLVYPALVEARFESDRAHGFSREHGEVRRMISDFRLAQAGDGDFPPDGQERMARIMNAVARHVAEEEAQAFPALEANSTRNESLGEEVAALKRKLRTFSPLALRVDVGVPVRTAYDQWTQFEAFPQVLDHIKRVRQVDDAHLEWEAEVGKKEIKWTCEIYEQIPDERIAWKSQEGAPNAGSVSFRALGPTSTRILLEITFEPRGLLENLGALVGLPASRIAEDLQQFKAFLETRLKESGAWRGRIEGDPLDPHL